MFFLLVRLLAALSLDAVCIKFGFTFFLAPPASAVGPSALSGCIVGTGDDALKIHATKPQNQGGERTVRTTKRTAAFMGRVRQRRLAAFSDASGRRSRGRDV